MIDARGAPAAPPATGHPADVRSLVALLTGGVARPGDADTWARVAALATRECCGPLLWARAGGAIRREAPAEVAAGLRAHAVAQAVRLRRRLERAADAIGALAAGGVRAAMWKGMGLSALAHDDAFVRPSGDVDLWVPAGARGRARDVLLAAGWTRVEGEAPWEEAFERRFDGEDERLEVHSHLQGDLLAHLPAWRVEVGDLAIDGITVPVVQGPTLALSLAAHHARHRQAPLLWALDLRAILARTDADALARLAATLRMDGYLPHARRIVAAADALAAPVARADGTPAGDAARQATRHAATLGFAPGARDNGHPAWRDLAAAATLGDRVAVASAWLAPPRVRADGGLLRGTARRLARRIGGASERADAPSARADGDAAASAPTVGVAADALPPGRRLAVDRDDLEVMVRAVVGEAGAMWLRVHGRSMEPTIPSEALVRLVPLPERPLAAGIIALARMPDGSWALHRVRAERDGRVRLRGDGVVWEDQALPRAAILARADLVDTGDGPRPLASREPLTLFRLLRPLRRLRHRWRARVRRAGASREARA